MAGGGLREDEKKADRERERVAGVRGNGTRVGGAGDGTRGLGWVVGWVPDDGVGDEVSRTWSRTRRVSVRGMKRLRERDVGQILFPPTSD